MNIVHYEEAFGKYTFPEGFRERLVGRSIEEQMACYRTTGMSKNAHTGYMERTIKDGFYCRLFKDRDITALIVDDGLLVGVMIRNDNGRDEPCFPEESVCTYYSCDNNGAGYKERMDYTWLLCVPENFAAEA